MNLGFSTKGILAVVYCYTVILGIFSLIMVISKPELTMVLFGFILMIFIVSIYILRKYESVIMNLKQKDVFDDAVNTEECKKNVIKLKSKTG